MKLLILMTFLSFNTNADIVKRPDYQPDENHPAPSVMTPRQAQQEKVEKRSKKNVKQLEDEKERNRKALEKFKETEMNE